MLVHIQHIHFCYSLNRKNTPSVPIGPSTSGFYAIFRITNLGPTPLHSACEMAGSTDGPRSSRSLCYALQLLQLPTNAFLSIPCLSGEKPGKLGQPAKSSERQQESAAQGEQSDGARATEHIPAETTTDMMTSYNCCKTQWEQNSSPLSSSSSMSHHLCHLYRGGIRRNLHSPESRRTKHTI